MQTADRLPGWLNESARGACAAGYGIEPDNGQISVRLSACDSVGSGIAWKVLLETSESRGSTCLILADPSDRQALDAVGRFACEACLPLSAFLAYVRALRQACADQPLLQESIGRRVKMLGQLAHGPEIRLVRTRCQTRKPQLLHHLLT
jgi:hypothetical protein